MKIIWLFLSLCCLHLPLKAQLFTEKQTRHRFAQLNFGLDLQMSFGGETQYLDPQGSLQSLTYSGAFSPRFLIGGTHFWGHADFVIGIPLFASMIEEQNQEILALRGVETAFKFYPLRIEHNKVRPYIGTSIAPFYFEQSNSNFDYPNGPELNHTSLPLLGGISYTNKQQLFELGFAWNYANEQSYYIARDRLTNVTTPPLYATLSYRYFLDTTVGAEAAWESGKTAADTEALAEKGMLNEFYVGAGMSSAFWLKQSSYNELNRPYIEKYSTSIMPDFTVGYYNNNVDANLALGYRGYKSTTNTYGSVQQVQRRSFVLEATKFLFDYQGFVPFVGPALSYEELSFTEKFETNQPFSLSDNTFAYGLTFGWDIRPNRLQSFVLRTNLRCYPQLFLDAQDGTKVNFENVEFNFIQLIIYPGRMF